MAACENIYFFFIFKIIANCINLESIKSVNVPRVESVYFRVGFFQEYRNGKITVTTVFDDIYNRLLCCY